MKIFYPNNTQKNVPAIIVPVFLCCLLTLLSAPPMYAHFGMVIPTTNQVRQQEKQVDVVMAFCHPFEQSGMNLEWPKRAFVSVEGVTEDLKGIMKKTQFLNKNAWKFTYTPKRPGIYWFVLEPTPYWEPAEDLYIIHYTKTVISAYGEDQGWGTPLGLKSEIVPLIRPFGNYAGNTFTGTVLVDNKPVAGAEVEVELYNTEGWVAPSDAHITQVVKADENGNFSFTCPLPGWWGFSALTEADYTMKGPDGTDKQVELGAVIWVYFDPNPFLGQ